MTWLIISILTNTLLLLILKGFEKYRVNTLHGIVANYVVAATTGLCIEGIPETNVVMQGAGDLLWIPLALGFLFITIFFTLAKTAQVAGISVATVANKMSVVIPVIVAVILYKESLSVIKIIGIISALLAVYLTSKKSVEEKFNIRLILWPIVIFIGSGIIDAMVNHLEKGITSDALMPFLLSVAFMSAFFIGAITVGYRVIAYKERVTGRSLLGGFILGIPNYLSIYSITKALNADIMDSSQLYPVNNMGIVICSAIGAMIVFREKLSIINWVGILISIGAISMVAFS